jgi:hypothetical protein
MFCNGGNLPLCRNAPLVRCCNADSAFAFVSHALESVLYCQTYLGSGDCQLQHAAWWVVSFVIRTVTSSIRAPASCRCDLRHGLRERARGCEHGRSGTAQHCSMLSHQSTQPQQCQHSPAGLYRGRTCISVRPSWPSRTSWYPAWATRSRKVGS